MDRGTEGSDECGFGATTLCCVAQETNCYKPKNFAECCGSASSEYNGTNCFRTNQYRCICPGHPAFQGLSDERDDVCCILDQFSCTYVKPKFLSGEEPCYKYSAKGWCFTTRASFPRDDDAPGRCGCCWLYFPTCACCGEGSCGCCPKVSPLPEAAFGKYKINYSKLSSQGVEYVIHACLFSIVSVFIPEKVSEIYGQEFEETCCCYERTGVGSCCPCYFCGAVLPDKEGPEHEELYVRCFVSQKCVKPRVCCKIQQRSSCYNYKAAFPPDEDVPCGLACSGLTCCICEWRPEFKFSCCPSDGKYRNVYCCAQVRTCSCCRTKKRDEDDVELTQPPVKDQPL